MSGYSIIRYWSIAHSCRVLRVSLSDERGGEHYMTVPVALLRGRDYRGRLDGVIGAVQAAIDAGEAPGEVCVGW